MRFVIQRVTRARVEVDERTVGSIGKGLLVLAGFGKDDYDTLPGSPVWEKMINKVLDLRIFPDEQQRLNLSLRDLSEKEGSGGLLLVSQFTLYADCRKGRRPSFTSAALPEPAEKMYDLLVRAFRDNAPGPVETGMFGQEMFLDFTNWGPVTITLDSTTI